MSFIRNREEYAKIKRKILAPYACRQTRGRVNTEEECNLRIPFQRDRDKILFSPAFRRLEFKTQVYVYRESDYFRTRLTHTLEVMQTSTEIARFLGLNEDLTEAIALGHDLGHAPFGHAGQDILNELMMNHGGFRHNEHSLRIVSHLERFGRFENGLNLTWEVREGILKHTDVPNRNLYPEFFDSCNRHGTLETQAVNVSDELVQVVHDIDDAIRASVVQYEEIKDLVENANLQDPYGEELRRYGYRDYTSWLLGPLMNDLTKNSFSKIRNLKYDDISRSEEFFVQFGSLNSLFEDLQAILDRIHKSPMVSRMNYKGKKIIKSLFEAFMEDYEMLPEEDKQKISHESQHRVICDYIASLTDKGAHELYDKMFLPFRE